MRALIAPIVGPGSYDTALVYKVKDVFSQSKLSFSLPTESQEM